MTATPSLGARPLGPATHVSVEDGRCAALAPFFDGGVRADPVRPATRPLDGGDDAVLAPAHGSGAGLGARPIGAAARTSIDDGLRATLALALGGDVDLDAVRVRPAAVFLP